IYNLTGKNTNFLSSDTGPSSLTVSAAGTTTTLVAAPQNAGFGQNVTFTATVSEKAPSKSIPTGSVTLFVDGSPISPSVALNSSGKAIFTLNNLPFGPHSVYAEYNTGNVNTNFALSDSATITENIVHATTTSVTPTPGSSVFGQGVTFTANISAVGSA